MRSLVRSQPLLAYCCRAHFLCRRRSLASRLASAGSSYIVLVLSATCPHVPVKADGMHRGGRSSRAWVGHGVQDGYIPVTCLVLARGLLGFVPRVRVLACQPYPPHLGNVDLLALNLDLVGRSELGCVLVLAFPVRLANPVQEPLVGFGQVLHAIAHDIRRQST